MNCAYCKLAFENGEIVHRSTTYEKLHTRTGIEPPIKHKGTDCLSLRVIMTGKVVNGNYTVFWGGKLYPVQGIRGERLEENVRDGKTICQKVVGLDPSSFDDPLIPADTVWD